LLSSTALAAPVPYAEISAGFRAGLENAQVFSTQIIGDPVAATMLAFGSGVAEAPASVSLMSPFYGPSGPTVGVGVRASTDGFGSAHASADYSGRIRFTNISDAPAQPLFAFYAAGNEGHAAVIENADTQSARVQASGSFQLDGSSISNGLPNFNCAASFDPLAGGPTYQFCARPYVFTGAGTLSGWLSAPNYPTIDSGSFIDVLFSISVDAWAEDSSAAPQFASRAAPIDEVPEPATLAILLAGLAGLALRQRIVA
jgi:hypothetical protein